MFRTSSSAEGEGILVGKIILSERIHLSGPKVSAKTRTEVAGHRQGRNHTAVESAVVVDHKHDLPLENIAVCYSTADAGNVFVSLHLFELTSKQATCCRSRHDSLQRTSRKSRSCGSNVDGA